MRCEVDALEHKLQDTKYEKSAPGELKLATSTITASKHIESPAIRLKAP